MRIERFTQKISEPAKEPLRVPPRVEAPPHFPGAVFDVVGIAASAGGLSALLHLARDLPRTFPAALVVVQHLDPRHRSLMAEILSRSAALAVEQAAGGVRVRLRARGGGRCPAVRGDPAGPRGRAPGEGPDVSTTAESRSANLLAYLRRSRGFAFPGYKPPSLIRRVGKRMQTAGMRDFGDYTDYLEVHPEEFAQLFNHLLINVTSFFRDPVCWDYLTDKVIPQILSSRKAGEPIRVWNAGCASGEEAYTLAQLLVETLGRDGFKTRVKIYASDVDEEALGQARRAAYSARDLQAVPAKFRKKYFLPADGRFTFDDALPRSLIFGRHDLVQDAPISRLHLLVCRNTLMYFNAETHARILARFHFALNEGGSLFLGKAETILQQANVFKPAEIRHRIFIRTGPANLRDRLLVLAQANGPDAGQQISRQVRMRELAFEKNVVPQIVLDASGAALLVNDRARAVCGVGARDIRRPVHDLR